MIYAATIFLSSFLLFLVQPLIARLILPWFGGSAAVWTTCMLFFQALLLAGYAYAHFLVRRSSRFEPVIHSALLVVALATLPIAPNEVWKPVGHRGAGELDPARARRERRPALFPAGREQPAAAGLVRARAAEPESLPPVRGVEPRLAGRAARLSVPARAATSAARAR